MSLPSDNVIRFQLLSGKNQFSRSFLQHSIREDIYPLTDSIVSNHLQWVSQC